MTVGTDSYVTAAEADSYIAARYTATSADRIRWNALSTVDKDILLVDSCYEIEILPFRGRKVLKTQPLSFPRRIPFQSGVAETPEVPDGIKFAQIELALYLSDKTKVAEQSQRQSLQSQGVRSFSLGDLSESYRTGSSQKAAPLLCPKCALFLRPHLSGGAAIC